MPTVISGAVPFIRDYFRPRRGRRHSQTRLGSELSGVGRDGRNLAAGMLSDRFGRKGATADLHVVSGVRTDRCAVTSFTVFVMARSAAVSRSGLQS